MNNNDQWFEPGQKVMRVAVDRPIPSMKNWDERVGFGEVFCVSIFLEDKGFNWIELVGFDDIYLASNFRKVEEIKLCVEALKKAKAPAKQEA